MKQCQVYSVKWNVMLQGEIENWSLPVELLLKKLKPGGPLEPTKEEWLILNKKLVDQGLAIPIRG
jgi:hypothetical protein